MQLISGRVKSHLLWSSLSSRAAFILLHKLPFLLSLSFFLLVISLETFCIISY